ncbi:hypothetical protein [Streptomyces sp. SP18CS02]|uniref:hypothetical protein n=1 Tax=Streptomyces sp. SP18CS02 TaxID=3002531 RepID=UPI002E780BDD|nr:hypothetical protein [Streptomyces sp. SP18CS02]MEE1753013.1 hypothetical protein [Streptomyces sp. SP18CS02]
MATATALLLSLISAPAAAAPLQARDPATTPLLACPEGGQQIPPATGWESMYALRVNEEHNCAELTNISDSKDAIYGRVLLLRGEGPIAGPMREPNLGGATHWVRQTAATAAEEALAEQGATGWAVILPGESVSYEWYDPANLRYSIYEVDVADAQVAQRVKVSEILAAQAADDAVKKSSEKSNALAKTINDCAAATKQAWAEVAAPGSPDAGLPNVLKKMRELPECEEAYDAIKDIKTIFRKGGILRQKIDEAAEAFGDAWTKGLQDDAKKLSWHTLRALS